MHIHVSLYLFFFFCFVFFMDCSFLTVILCTQVVCCMDVAAWALLAQ